MQRWQRVLQRALQQPGAVGEALAAVQAVASGGELAVCRSLGRSAVAVATRGFRATAQQAWRHGVARPTVDSWAAAHVSAWGPSARLSACWRRRCLQRPNPCPPPCLDALLHSFCCSCTRRACGSTALRLRGA